MIVISATARARRRPDPLPVANRSAIVVALLRYGRQTTLTEVDVSDPSAMKVTRTMTVDGRFVDARQNGSTARFVISSAPQAIVEPEAAAGRERLGADAHVPRAAHRPPLRARRRRVHAIRRPVQFSGLGMLTIITVDFDKGLGMAHSDALMADAQIVYGSQSKPLSRHAAVGQPGPAARACPPRSRR